MEKNQIIELTVEDMLDDGRAFGRYEGCAVFISGGISVDGNNSGASGRNSDKSADRGPTGGYGCKITGAIPGDTVSARVTKAKKSAAEAVLMRIISPSPDRVKAECPYAAECGGCSLQEMSYEAQKKLKTKQLISKLQRLGGIEDPKVNEMIGAVTLKYYRNKAVFAVGPNGEVGFRKGKSHHVIDVDDCMLQSDAAMVCADALRKFLKDTGIRCISQMTVKTAFGTGEVMVVLEKSDEGDDLDNGGRGGRSGPKGRKGGKQNNNAKGSRGKDRNKRGNESADIPQIELLAELLDDAVYSLNRTDEEYSESSVNNADSKAESDAPERSDENAGSNSDVLTEGMQRRYSLESLAVIHQGKCRIIAGKPTITDIVRRGDGREFKFEIAPQSFYQVNPEQMVKLYDKAMEYAFGSICDEASECPVTGNDQPMRIDQDDKTESNVSDHTYEPDKKRCDIQNRSTDKPETENSAKIGTLLDLYCGVGTIGIWMADRAEQVIGIESVKSAVIDANRNSVINGLVNTRYICGKAEEELPGMMGLAKLYKWNEVNERVEREPDIRIGSADVAVVDPPRAGCGEALLAAVATASPGRIVYVSCDPGTLARDIKYLTAHGYEFIGCTAIDQFPMTTHTECVSLMRHS